MGLDDEQEVIIPVEQDTVMLFGLPIIAARLPDGRIAEVLDSLCAALSLQTHSQARRIRADDMIGDQLLPARIVTDGGAQEMSVLTAWALPTWLHGIRAKMAAEEKRPAILAFKREAADVLYRHFAQPRLKAIETPAPLVPAEPIVKPERPTDDAAAITWAEYHRQMSVWYEWRADLDQWRREATDQLVDHGHQIEELHSRMESNEELSRVLADALSHFGPETLSAERQQSVQAMVNRLHDLAGFSHATIYNELRSAFHVGTYKDIPEMRWQEVVEWFQQRIDFAEKRKR